MTRWRTLAVVLAALNAASPAVAKDRAIVRYRVVEALGPENRPSTTTINLISVVGSNGLTRHWIAAKGTRPGHGKAPPRLWIDGRNCPALNGTIAELLNLSADKGLIAPAAPDPHRPRLVTLIGPMSPKGPGPLAFGATAGPLHTWWDEAHTQLATCWNDGGVELNGKHGQRP